MVTKVRCVSTALAILIAFAPAHLLAQSVNQPLPVHEKPIKPEKIPPATFQIVRSSLNIIRRLDS